MGIATLALQNWQNPFWVRHKSTLSLLFNIIGVLLFVISRQSYAAAFLFIFLIIKGLMLIKWQ